MRFFKGMFQDSSDMVFRSFRINGKTASLIFIDGLVNTKDIHEHVLTELLHWEKDVDLSVFDYENDILSLTQVEEENVYKNIVKKILAGSVVLLIDGKEKAIIIDATQFETRSIAEPESEAAIRGPREGFIESLRVNTSLIRRKLRTEDLKVVSKTAGEKTNTNMALIYLDEVVDRKVLAEVEARLDRIKIDGVLETGYIEELIEDNPWSLFPQVQITERPDTVAANVLEGRIALVVDGTPFVMILPATFWQQFQASEDYYDRFYVGTFLRMLRLIFLGIATLLPALYVAITTFHQEMIPTNLLLSIAASREAIPFPAIVEAFIMEISFEALREAGVRLPKTIGQAVSILGALVIGTAAVEAGIVSAPMVIVVSLTGIASFTIPKFSLAISVRLIRFPLMILGGVFGLFGIIVGAMMITAHLCKLRTFGVPYFSPIAPLKIKELRDIFIRIPIWKYNRRPEEFTKTNVKRQSNNLYPSPNRGE
ncbi:spore germination protein [Evansella cellulosilytica]|uniref:GerA spore germination protein n=1 Tax=Evansella cellulosilytica (strain ATCC 21833 / DSM 2522 / FERM P-1141 / JCM 9156 / N-4) TaxID=649639 RepID=E6U0Z4_EVAC2|nr:spore germination protein [Evansella cellulosilytica]ADU30306.1 GerA spore germination protein [Evansella cellulosilytica DSM 2522]